MRFETPTPQETHNTFNAIEQPKPIPETTEEAIDNQSKKTKMPFPDLNNQSARQEQKQEDQHIINQIRQQLGLENENLEIEQENLNPEEAKVRLFALMDEIQETNTTPTNKAE